MEDLISFIDLKENRKDKQSYFSKVTNSFARNTDLNVTEKMMYIYLQGYGYSSFPSQKTIMEHLKLSKPTVIKTLSSLQDKGYLYIQKRYDKKNRLTNLHFLAEINEKTGKPTDKDFVKIQKLLHE